MDVPRALIDAGLAVARARWPAFPDAAAFDAYLAERAAVQSSLERLRVEDLALAWWTTTGDARAIAAFEAAYREVIDRLLARFHRLDADELRQQLRIKLFSDGRIRDYAGFGFLENWLKIVASRAFVDAARRVQRTEELPDDLEVAGSDPRNAIERAEVLAAVKRALEKAIADLPGRERTFLRHVTVDGLTLDQIAATYQLHRVTVARALASAREQLYAATRGQVVAELGVTNPLHLLDSQIDLSLQRLFPEPTL